jgi:hypothetical protein
LLHVDPAQLLAPRSGVDAPDRPTAAGFVRPHPVVGNQNSFKPLHRNPEWSPWMSLLPYMPRTNVSGLPAAGSTKMISLGSRCGVSTARKTTGCSISPGSAWTVPFLKKSNCPAENSAIDDGGVAVGIVFSSFSSSWSSFVLIFPAPSCGSKFALPKPKGDGVALASFYYLPGN